MKKAKFKTILAAIFMFALLAAGMIAPANFATVYAAENTSSSALEDLKKDSAFRSADYPAKTDTKYSFNVIQIAESATGELFVYTYQPSAGAKKLSATSVSISTTINEDYEPKLYKLKELNSQGVFGKYLVNDCRAQSGSERYYDISEIFRAWNSEIDKPATGASGTTISEVSFAVGKLFTARTQDGKISYECITKETIEILNPIHGSLRYMNGFTLPFSTSLKSSCDSWFVAFNTDKKIDKLMSATVYYVAREYITNDYPLAGDYPTTKYGTPQELYAKPTDKDKASNNPHLWIKGKPRVWDRIQSVTDFIGTEDLTTEMKAAVLGKQWVLRFVETDYQEAINSAFGITSKKINGTEISDISILRLQFETDEIVYNLGAVDNKYTPDINPDNVQPEFDFWRYVWNCIVKFFQGKADFVESLVAIVAILVVLLLFPLIVFILSLVFPAFRAVVKAIFKGLWICLVWVAKGLWWLICLPFRIIAAPFKAISKRRKKDKSA